MLTNINTTEYWNGVYRGEWTSGQALSGEYHRDYGPIHDAIIALVPDRASVLDIACGPGVLCRKIKQRCPGSEVLGVDFSNYVVSRNQERDRALGIDYRALDVRTSLPEIARTFDVVCMCEFLEHLEDPEGVVREAMGLLKIGGTFILTCPHDDAIPDPEHLRCWSHDELFHLLAPYSNQISFTHFSPPYFHVWMMAHLTKAPTLSAENAASGALESVLSPAPGKGDSPGDSGASS